MANVTFSSTVSWTGHGLDCLAKVRDFVVHMDEPKELGGTDQAMNPVELLLSALGGCQTICAVAFAPLCKVNLVDFRSELEGDLDPDGFQGKNPHVRKGFQQIRYKWTFVTDSPRENVEKLAKLIEERCPVSDTLKGVAVVNAAPAIHITSPALAR
ncbi:MAG: OsmC family protein [Firmicutes bacterium]|nr:OsmC family protein [Bacillota bacterium]